MSKNPKINLHRLREIGWLMWDPISLLANEEEWQGQPFEDEYDTYLIKVAGMLKNGCSLSKVVKYLQWIESEYMGFGAPVNKEIANARLHKLVETIKNDPNIWNNKSN